MAKLRASPQVLIDRLLRALPHPPSARAPAAPPTEDRILDAALAAFTARGIRATTMSQLAQDAGISREWLYKHFRNRDSVVIAVARREAVRFIDGLAAQAFTSNDLAEILTDTFVYSVEFLRDHALLQRVLDSEPDVVSGQLIARSSPVLSGAIQAGGGYLTALTDIDEEHATILAETLVRLVGAITLAPQGHLDLHDPAVLRRYAATVVPGIFAAAHTVTPRADNGVR